MIVNDILRYNRNPNLSDFFTEQLEKLIGFGYYPNNIGEISRKLISTLFQYSKEHNINTVIVGMSGGIDSALTASLFKAAGYKVIGVTLPIQQKHSETERAIETCKKLDIQYINYDLTAMYNEVIGRVKGITLDPELLDDNIECAKRRGNIRARLRMMTLYNLASKHGGMVASTDNFSELAAGFWTLHGDVGDVAPIQSLTKSWEVPAMAEYMGVPESVIQAKPTDGLGIADCDEEQFGFSYLEFDIVLLNLISGNKLTAATEADQKIIDTVKNKISSTQYKRNNPLNLDHPFDRDRFRRLSNFVL